MKCYNIFCLNHCPGITANCGYTIHVENCGHRKRYNRMKESIQSKNGILIRWTKEHDEYYNRIKDK